MTTPDVSYTNLDGACKECGAPIRDHILGGPAPYHPRPVVQPSPDVSGGDGNCGCTERCKDRDNCQYDVVAPDVKEMAERLRDREAIVMGGLLYCGPLMREAADLLDRLSTQAQGDVNDLVKQIVSRPPQEQYDLAFKVAENIGYELREIYDHEKARDEALDSIGWFGPAAQGEQRRMYQTRPQIESLPVNESANAKSGIVDWLTTIEDNCWDLRCVNVPTGGDDYDVGWRVIEHYMAHPNERIIGYGNSPLEALNDAKSGIAK